METKEKYENLSIEDSIKLQEKIKLGNKKSPCNYTLGGLFNLGKMEVIDDEGKKHSVFEFADEFNTCEVCHKKKEDVRFEGISESYICDDCLFKQGEQNEGY